MSYAWALVGLAVVCEIAAAIGLRNSDGFTRMLPTGFAVIVFVGAFYCVSLSLVHLPVSTVYPVWAGGGTAGVALVGMLVLKEPRGVVKVIGIALVVAGIVALNMAS